MSTPTERGEMRARTLLTETRLDTPPIDPIVLARYLGLQVWTSGLSRKHVVMLDDREMYLAADASVNLQRFACAHAVGHFLLQPGCRRIDKRTDFTADQTAPDEIECNQFAAALLMPADRLQRLYEHDRLDVRALAGIFGTSMQALRARLRNLNMIDTEVRA